MFSMRTKIRAALEYSITKPTEKSLAIGTRCIAMADLDPLKLVIVECSLTYHFTREE